MKIREKIEKIIYDNFNTILSEEKAVDSILSLFQQLVKERIEKTNKYPMIFPDKPMIYDKPWNDGYRKALDDILSQLGEKEDK